MGCIYSIIAWVHETWAQNAKKSLVQYSNLLKSYVDTIFVLPDLGTYQGMSTKLGDQNISKNIA